MPEMQDYISLVRFDRRESMKKPEYKYHLIFVVENGNVREIQEDIEVDYHTYIETFEKVRT